MFKFLHKLPLEICREIHQYLFADCLRDIENILIDDVFNQFVIFTIGNGWKALRKI